MTETIKVSESFELHAVTESHAAPLYRPICKDGIWLQQSLNWPQFVQSKEDTRKTVRGDVMLHRRRYIKMFMIFKEDELIDVISFNRIESPNKTTEIGYWLDESHQRQGIVSQALQALIYHYIRSDELRRFAIECRVDNAQSNQVALCNGFILEGRLRQAEFLNDAYDDVSLYAHIIDSQ